MSRRSDDGARELLTLPAMQRLLGMKGADGRKLKRLLFAAERRRRCQIMARLGGARRTDYRVSLAAIRRHLPEILPARERSKVDDLARNFRDYLRGIDVRIDERVSEQIAEQVTPRLEELWARDETVAGSVKDLAKRVDRLARAR